ncbi:MULTISPECIES: hypothetical protein [unclassified Microbulbifer]|uniref:hypothetical protein n=1 Tax=unclassified Microbulbifer TaxID=2619833 RepID=UPI0027E5BC03|nr:MULTISPECIES: hypothetical protein [unclassified Microbulbifer]
MKSRHPWILVGPWYRSESVGGPPANRSTAPILQKYGDAGFMDKFTREPQHSLRFACEDFVDRLCVDPNKIITPELREQLDDSLKLFQHAHSRFYLVVCELHCVAPGFPSARREQVCETGFVVRRKVPMVGKALQPELLAKQHRLRRVKQRLVKLEGKHGKKSAVFSQAFAEIGNKRVASLKGELQESIDDLQTFIVAHHITAQRQGWIPSENDEAIGNWQPVESKPQTITEKVYPLYPLQPDPQDDTHSAQGKTLWFGLVPTAGSDIDSLGNPQFDESDLYEIQCFVRRKKDCCEGRGRNCCHGEVVWSQPTQNYRLAAFFDIDGTSHKPINIKMPDLLALKDQANLGPPGRGAGVKTIAPANSSLNFGTDGMDMPSINEEMLTRPGQQICFFAILLFFIVALFLFRLFLPIIMFLFQLWFLLKLKLCIPPSIDLDVGIAADLEVHGPDIEAAIDLDVGVLAEIGGGFNSKAELQTALAKGLGEELSSAGGSEGPANAFAGKLENKLKNSITLNELADLYISMSRDFSEDPNPEAPTGQLPLPEDGLVYFDKVAMP